MAMIQKQYLLIVMITLCTIFGFPFTGPSQTTLPSEGNEVLLLPALSSEASDESSSPTEEIVEIEMARQIIAGEKVDLGKEMEEPEGAFKLFKSEADIERLLGTTPRFVYNPKELPDPMIVPWIKRDVVVREIIEAARRSAARGEFDKAKNMLKKALEDYPDSRHVGAVREEIGKVEKLEEKGIIAMEAQKEVIVLPSWITSNTNGILWSEEKPLVLIGDFLLAEGASIPRFPNVTIQKINKQEVVYSYRDRIFSVTVHGNK
jgi:hypothetical protein